MGNTIISSYPPVAGKKRTFIPERQDHRSPWSPVEAPLLELAVSDGLNDGTSHLQYVAVGKSTAAMRTVVESGYRVVHVIGGACCRGLTVDLRTSEDRHRGVERKPFTVTVDVFSLPGRSYFRGESGAEGEREAPAHAPPTQARLRWLSSVP